MMTMDSSPVASSTSCFMVTPSMMSWNFTLPASRENRHIVRIPLDKGVGLLDAAAVLDGNHGANDDRMAFEFAAIIGENGYRPILVQYDVCCRPEFNRAQIV